MRVAELLRKLADVIAAAETGGTPPEDDRQFNKPDLQPVEVDNEEGKDAQAITMIPPLQQKLEILKKSVGVDNEFDRGFDSEESSNGDTAAELTVIKKNAGLTAPQIESIDDEPLDQ